MAARIASAILLVVLAYGCVLHAIGADPSDLGRGVFVVTWVGYAGIMSWWAGSRTR